MRIPIRTNGILQDGQYIRRGKGIILGRSNIGFGDPPLAEERVYTQYFQAMSGRRGLFAGGENEARQEICKGGGSFCGVYQWRSVREVQALADMYTQKRIVCCSGHILQ